MSTNRTTQIVEEIVIVPDTEARTTQVVIELVHDGTLTATNPPAGGSYARMYFIGL